MRGFAQPVVHGVRQGQNVAAEKRSGRGEDGTAAGRLALSGSAQQGGRAARGLEMEFGAVTATALDALAGAAAERRAEPAPPFEPVAAPEPALASEAGPAAEPQPELEDPHE